MFNSIKEGVSSPCKDTHREIQGDRGAESWGSVEANQKRQEGEGLQGCGPVWNEWRTKQEHKHKGTEAFGFMECCWGGLSRSVGRARQAAVSRCRPSLDTPRSVDLTLQRWQCQWRRWSRWVKWPILLASRMITLGSKAGVSHSFSPGATSACGCLQRAKYNFRTV